MCSSVVDWLTTARCRRCVRYACAYWMFSTTSRRGCSPACRAPGGLRALGGVSVSSAGSTRTPFNCAYAVAVTTAGVYSSITAPSSAASRFRLHWFRPRLKPRFQHLPEPNRACLVGVYAFLIWNNLCDLVYQTPNKSCQSQIPVAFGIPGHMTTKHLPDTPC